MTYPHLFLLFETFQAARLCIRVVGGLRRSENKRRGTWGRKESSLRQSTLKDPTTQDRIFHWVNMQILDHRSHDVLWVGAYCCCYGIYVQKVSEGFVPIACYVERLCACVHCLLLLVAIELCCVRE